MQVLAVDDSSTIKLLLKQIFGHLELENYTIASNGAAAKEFLLSAWTDGSPYDLVLCDWNMPDIEGIDVLRWVRSHKEPAIQRVKFIMITSSDEKVRIAMDEGANNFVSKPMDKDSIKRKIDFVFL